MNPLLLCLPRLGLAATPAYYHPDEVASQSVRFAEVARADAPAFDRAQNVATRLGEALAELEVGVALLGDTAPPSLVAWAEAARRDGLAMFLGVQRYSNQLQDGYSGAFQAAMDRALPKVSAGREVVVCQAKRVLGPGMALKACTGEDLSGALASAMDADPALGKALAELGAGSWPEMVLPRAEQPVVPLLGQTRWISAKIVATALMGARLEKRADALESAQELLEEDLAARDSAAMAQAERLKAEYLAGLAADGQVLREALAASLERAGRGLPAEIGLCANPVALGGCAGEDATAQALPVLKADRKLAKDLERRLLVLP